MDKNSDGVINDGRALRCYRQGFKDWLIDSDDNNWIDEKILIFNNLLFDKRPMGKTIYMIWFLGIANLS